MACAGDAAITVRLNYAKGLRRILIDKITTDDIVRTLRPLWNTKPETATKVRELHQAGARPRQGSGLRAGDNPGQWKGHLDQIPSPPNRSLARKNPAAMAYADDANIFGQATRNPPASQPRCLEFAILTAACSGRRAAPAWDEVDLGQEGLDHPGRKDEGRQRTSSAAVGSRQGLDMAEMKATAVNELVFPCSGTRGRFSDAAVAKALQDRQGDRRHLCTGFGQRSGIGVAEETQFQREVAGGSACTCGRRLCRAGL